ncbi:hypothetical protein [Echinicola pacifica]|uniref:hypothetical protein n=1 Tax=Echinicola pacifica TaxID=346377 RepID=UPI00036B79BA|nr:hypothetical protein [Echinicola pacifica]
MNTISLLIVLIGFLFLYYTSQKAQLGGHSPIRTFARRAPQLAKGIGVFCLLVAALLAVLGLGLGAGIFSFIVLLMTVGSLVVIVAPLQIVTGRMLAIGLVLSLIIELI